MNSPDLAVQREGKESLKKLEARENELLNKLVTEEEELKKAKDDEAEKKSNLENLQEKLNKAQKKQQDDQDMIDAERRIDIARRRAEEAAARAQGTEKPDVPERGRKRGRGKESDEESSSDIQSHVNKYNSTNYTSQQFNELISKLYTLDQTRTFDPKRLQTKHNRKNELNNIALILINKYLTSNNIGEKPNIKNILMELKKKYNEIYKSIE